MNTTEIQNLLRTIQKYANSTFLSQYIGLCDYKKQNILSHEKESLCKFSGDPRKMKQVIYDHGYNISMIINFLVNDQEWVSIGKMRDYKHERESPVNVVCLDDVERREARWIKFFTNAFGKIVKIIFNIRVHEASKDTVVGIISCFDQTLDSLQRLRNYSEYKRNYDLVQKRFKRLSSLDEIAYRKKVSMVKVRLRDTGCEFDITEENLSKLCELDVFSLEAVNECDEERLLEERLKFRDPLKLRPYYSKNDRVNDPNGSKHECYRELYSYDDYNEENLLRYNHSNVKIFNELLDMKYDEIGGRNVITNEYLELWPESGEAFNAIAYGDDQNLVYKNLCAAFGKERVDHLWNNYYGKSST